MKKFWIKFALRAFGNLLIIGGIVLLGSVYVPIVTGELWYMLKTYRKQIYSLNAKGAGTDSVFARYLTADPIQIVPVNREFSIVVEKIDLNVPVVRNVPVNSESAYMESLKSGVAHASGTALPGERGNTYLFAHSSINFFQLGRYSMAFNLLRKLEVGDKVHVFYSNKDYTYEVADKQVVPGWNTFYLSRVVMEPTLTLQTCDPPGTTWNRLVVTSKLIEVR